MFLPCSGEQVLESLVCQVCVPLQASIYLCVCLLLCRMPLLVGQVSLSACASAAVGIVCVCMCVRVVYQLVGWRCGVFDYFLPYIAMTGHVVSPVVAGGQQRSSLLAPLPSLSKTRTQVLPVGITWVSPYVCRPSTLRLERQAGTTGTRLVNS